MKGRIADAPLKRVAIFQIRSVRFRLLILRMSPETGSRVRETCVNSSQRITTMSSPAGRFAFGMDVG